MSQASPSLSAEPVDREIVDQCGKTASASATMGTGGNRHDDARPAQNRILPRHDALNPRSLRAFGGLVHVFQPYLKHNLTFEPASTLEPHPTLNFNTWPPRED